MKQNWSSLHDGEKPSSNFQVLEDMLVIKSQKKISLVSRMIVLALVMICGAYICSICIKQKGFIISQNIVKIEQIDSPCPDPNVPQSEIQHIHYPEPVTNTRHECKCTPVLYFAIVSMQRCGSGWFETFLNSHINISSHGEIFSVKDRRANISTIVKTLDTIYNLDWFNSASKNECTSAVGLKWMLNQGLILNHKEIASYFKQKHVSIIFLFRRNLLRRWISILANNHDQNAKQLNGTHKAHVNSRDEAAILAKFKPAIDTKLMMSKFVETQKMTRDALSYFNGSRHVVLYYEDLIRNKTQMKDVLEFLRVPQRKLESRHVKIHTRPLHDQVENWESVLKTLNGTEYERFLQA